MKFVYFAILGLLVFNGVLILTASIFDSGLEGTAVDVEGNYGDYSLSHTNTTSLSIVNTLFSSSALGAWGSVFGVIVGFSVVMSIWLGKYIIAAVGLFLGLVTALYMNLANVFFHIYNNVYITGIITLVGIAIGILVLYNVIEMFTGQAGDV
jgi:hypothetical protein